MLYRSIIRICLISVVLTNPDICRAEDISFDYIQVNFDNIAMDPRYSNGNKHGNGFGFELSLSTDHNFAIALSVEAMTFDQFQDQPVDTTKLTLFGLTLHRPLAPNTQLYGTLAAAKAEVGYYAGPALTTDTDYGAELGLGIRHSMTDKIELDLLIKHLDIYDDSSDTIQAVLRYRVKKKYHLGFGFKRNTSIEIMSFNFRADI